MNKETIKELALANGFKLKEQPDGTMDLNPYVFEFAAALERVATAELKAQVEQLQIIGKALISQAERAMIFDIGNYNALKKCANDFDDAIQLTPAQCLLEIKAQAVIDAIDAHNLLTFDFNTAIRVTDLIKYANQLRQQAKAG